MQRHVAARLWDVLAELLFPPHCAACRRPGAWLCSECVAAAPGEGLLHQVHWPWLHTGELAGAYALAPHVYPLREAIHALKYDGVRVLAKPLAELLAAAWSSHPLPVDLVAPVPLHSSRVRQRGYNQAELLARVFCAHSGLPLTQGDLVRQRATRSQVGLSVGERRANVAGAFTCRSDRFRGRRVLLMDDVLTTGATLMACASALRAGGAQSVWAMTLTWAEDGQDSGRSQ